MADTFLIKKIGITEKSSVMQEGGKYMFHVKLSALYHDIGKPKTRRPWIKKAYTFYGHEVVGARITKKIMERMKRGGAEWELI